jgi:hypothetical protein
MPWQKFESVHVYDVFAGDNISFCWGKRHATTAFPCDSNPADYVVHYQLQLV